MKNVRTCIACRIKKDKGDLLRIARNKQGEIVIDEDSCADGRGAYVCKNTDCINKLIKTKALNRAFKSPIPLEFYDKLGEKLSDK